MRPLGFDGGRTPRPGWPASAFSFTIDGRLIRGDAAMEFFGNSAFGDLADGVRAEVKGQQRDGFVYAVRIHVNTGSDDDDGQDESASIEGTLTSKTGGVPMLTLIVGGTTVHTTGSTIVRRGGDVQDLTVLDLGMTLHVVGERQSDSSIAARLVQIKGDAVGGAFEIEGSMGGLHGTCPVIEFGINGYEIRTHAGTVFSPACSQFKSGTATRVVGIVQADGSVRASSVTKQ
jgi:hypothetical protein